MRGRVEFQELDGDDASVKPLMDKYQVHGFPTFVMVDSRGTVLYNEAGAWQSAEDFANQIKEFLP